MPYATDTHHRFMFDNLPVRGAWLRLSSIVTKARDAHDYTPEEATLLGEALAAVVLIGGVSQEGGRMLLQFRGEGALEMLSAQATQSGFVRGMLQRGKGEVDAVALTQGQLTVIYQSDKAAQQYQSVVPVGEGGLIPSIEHYFLQSEQIQTKVYVFEQAGQLTALLLQALPDEDPERQADAFNHVVALAGTLKAEEVFAGDNETLLHKLYHEDTVRVFEPKVLTYGCENPQRRYENAVLSLGKTEADKVLDEHTTIEVKCEFCSKTFTFDRVDVAALFEGGAVSAGKTLH
jgi:molecular chaperone Hsp33